MKRRWYILAVLAAGLAAAAVWFWPDGPLWRSGPGAGRMEGFSPDATVFLTSRPTYLPGVGSGAVPEVCHWDAATGRLLARVRFPCGEIGTMREVRPSADGRTVLVGEGSPDDPSRADFATGDWYIHDGVTGLRRAGPIRGVALVTPFAFSSDGRWFRGRRGVPHGGFKTLKGDGIYSSETGEAVLELEDRDGLEVGQCRFAPDGATAALAWLPKDRQVGDVRWTVQILELPSGRERRHFELPPRPWVGINKWDGRYLVVRERVREDPPDQYLERACTFDLSQELVSEGVYNPLLSARKESGMGPIYWIDGPGWLVYCSILSPGPPPPRWWNWVPAWLRGSGPPTKRIRVAVRFVDRATGTTTLYEPPRPLGHPIMVAPDGRRLACAHDDEAVEVWDVGARSWWQRVLAAGAAGLAAAAGVLVVGRWRRSPTLAGAAG